MVQFHLSVLYYYTLHMKHYLWKGLGLFFVGMAYVGAVVPGIPMTTFVLLALWAFSKSSPKLHDWVWNHPTFGPTLHRWTEYRIYPLRAKLIMLFFCSTSFIYLFLTLSNFIALLSIGAFMTFWLVWAFRYPSNMDEYNYRKQNNKKIGWLK